MGSAIMFVGVTTLVWTLLAGCTQPAKEQEFPTWEDAAAVCPLTAPDGGAPIAGYSTMQPVSAECATWIGDIFELDWESFGEEARAFTQPISPAERTIAGLLVAFGTSGVSVGEVLAEGAPAHLDEELTLYAAENLFDPGDDAGRLWFEFLYWKIAGIRYLPEIDALMTYGNGTVTVGDVAGLYEGDDEGVFFGDPAYPAEIIASVLVHEAAHQVYPYHVDCSAESAASNDVPACDATENGAIGAGTWWMWTWLAKNGRRIAEYGCYDAVYGAISDCSRILDKSDFPACSFETDPCE